MNHLIKEYKITNKISSASLYPYTQLNKRETNLFVNRVISRKVEDKDNKMEMMSAFSVQS